MDLVSPIKFKKIDLIKFNKIDDDDNYSVIYDKFSKNLIQFNETSVKIFNKKATTLKKSFDLKLDRDKIKDVSVDKNMKYMLILLDYKMMLIVNLRNEKVSDILHYDFSTILGMFFINENSIYYSDEIKFLLVFMNKLVFFKISYTPNESINEFKNVKVNSILNFNYNNRFMILVLEKQDKIFEFYNLSNEKYYSKSHTFNYSNKLRRESSIGRLFSVFSRSSRLDNFFDVSNASKNSLYRRTQFFIEAIYKKIYFICLNYEENAIQFYEIENLNNLKKTKTILIDSLQNQLSTLQFLDNLVLLHNFERCDTLTIDIKSDNNENIIFKNFPMTNLDLINKEENVSMLSYNNRIFYEKDIIIQGSIIYDKEKKEHYYVFFCPITYYENTPVKYESVFNLIKRKNSKETILQALSEMIIKNYSIKILKIVFNKLIKQLQKNLYNLSMTTINSNQDIKNSSDLLYPKHYVLLRKKTLIKQPDMYYNLFLPLLDKEISPDYLLKIVTHFINSLFNYNIPIQPSFQSVLIPLLKKIKNKTLINILLQYHALPDSLELAKFLLSQHYTQTGIDMLIRLKRYEDVFNHLVSEKNIFEALLFARRYKIDLNFILLNHDLADIIKKNKEIFTDYISV